MIQLQFFFIENDTFKSDHFLLQLNCVHKRVDKLKIIKIKISILLYELDL